MTFRNGFSQTIILAAELDGITALFDNRVTFYDKHFGFETHVRRLLLFFFGAHKI